MPVAKTKDVEVTTGISAADNVFGRDANSQARKLFFFTFFIRAKVANILGSNKEFLLQGNTSRAEQHKKNKVDPYFLTRHKFPAVRSLISTTVLKRKT